MKRPALAAVLAAVAVGLGALWFFDNFEQVERQVWVGPSGAARANPYLAATRFLERMGYAVATIERPSDLDGPPAGGTLILLARRAALTPARAQSLLRWVADGGHLVIEPEPRRTRDFMLEALGVTRGDASNVKPAQTMTVEVPALDHALKVTPTLLDTLKIEGRKPDWTAADAGGVRLLSLRHGSGRVSVITGFTRFTNRAIAQHDNAELLWRIVRFLPANQSVLLFRPPRAAPFLAWLYDAGLAIAVSMLLVLLLWLWHVMPRFGPVLPAPEPERRQLLEHIRATGRFRWAQGGRESLLDAAREICHGRLARLRPRVALLPIEERCRELSAEVGIGADEIAYAFQGAPRAAREFVHTVATLASIHAALSRVARVPRLRKKRQ